MPTYSELSKALSKTSQKLHPSQAHGLVCGLLCGKQSKEADWEQLVAGGNTTKPVHKVLKASYDETARQLQAFDFTLQLVLPDEADALVQRAEAITLWCQGFLTGLKLVDVPIVDRESSEMTEAINDIIEIAKMNYEQVVASEEDEVAYAELVEFVRMAVVMIYQQIHDEEGVAGKEKPLSTHLH